MDFPRRSATSRIPESSSAKKIGQKHVKNALKRIAKNRPELLDEACLRVFEDAAGRTRVERAFIDSGEPVLYDLEISPDDRHRALAMIRDTLQGRPTQELQIEGGALTNVIVVRAQLGEAPEMPESVKRILAEKDSDDDAVEDGSF